MHLAVNYKLNGLQAKVVHCLRHFSLSNLDVLEAAVTAQELESIFPLASEALLANCSSIVQDSFATSEDFIEYVTQLSITNSEMSLVALKLWGTNNNQQKIG